MFQTLWQDTPQEPKSVAYKLPAGKTVTKVILYTWTVGEKATNEWRAVGIGVPGAAVSVLTAAPLEPAKP